MRSLAIAVIVAAVHAKELKKEHKPAHKKDDAGLFAGAQAGMFLMDESLIEKEYHCEMPEMDTMVQQFESMIPMMKMMATNMNGGKEPTYVKNLESLEHSFATIYTLLMGDYEGTEYCKGLIGAVEARKIALGVGSEMAGAVFGGAGSALF